MCLAIYKPAGNILPESWLAEAFRINDDGAGFAYVEKDTLFVKRGYWTFEQFIKEYQPQAEKQSLIHFRKCTHGGKTVENCHPFLFSGLVGGMAIAHNGIVDIKPANPGYSDTRTFVELVLQPISEFLPLNHPALKYLIEGSIGKWNKMVLLAANGDYVIYNETEGHWRNGCWFSNYTYWCYTSRNDIEIESGETIPIGFNRNRFAATHTFPAEDSYWDKKNKRTVHLRTVQPTAKFPHLSRKQRKIAIKLIKDGSVSVDDGGKISYPEQVDANVRAYIEAGIVNHGVLIVENGKLVSPLFKSELSKEPPKQILAEPKESTDGSVLSVPSEPPGETDADGKQRLLLAETNGKKALDYGPYDAETESEILACMRQCRLNRRQAVELIMSGEWYRTDKTGYDCP